ncbi:CAMK protein kinase [Phytophthora nicotianae P10297]|uniref:CAMK protein kinase n=3 Tax=Phytophthora nicotianae TaxID=4792 RepID=V9FW55_PHYNI|nr:CAMK protein kinase [Phytophthora nicotianae P1569]ETK95523.1 CAMK protein kinase [Phytophthora nicotianae]ETL48910.1 CAMK protein kinase [Phytophthora nicotianae]ETM55206.1 CAMK protein kinase [Phytophthora nicotianae]ETP53525.1 CAMK protein kinase [Phytophthora nicotianae P10297]
MATPELRFRRKIGDAMYGEVLEYELLQHQPNERSCVVAVKSINLSYAITARSRTQADRVLDDPNQECRVAKLLARTSGHRNVVKSFFQFQKNDSLYLVSEFCADGDLHTHLAKTGAVDEQFSIHIMAQIFDGVNFLHRNLNIAHRDLSLENVLMNNGECKISDFGLSVEATSRCFDRVGKDYYMAPEVVARNEYDPVKADVWSLGIIWFVLVTGSPLITIASQDNKAFLAMKECGVMSVFESWKVTTRLSAPVMDLISRMLKVDPAERIALDEILQHPCLDPESVNRRR